MVFSIQSILVSLLVASASAAPLESRGASAKKGVAYNVASLANAFKGTASWGYNWAGTSGGLDSSIAYVPMIHGTNNDMTGIKVGNNAPILLYNEPDMTTAGGGCAASPSVAASAYKSVLPKLNGARIGSPAVTSNNQTTTGPLGASGLYWLREFLPLVGGPTASKIGFVNLHWYGQPGTSAAAQAAALKSYLQRASADVNQMFNGKSMPLWLTEFAAEPTNDASVQAEFLDAIIPFLDSFAPLERYAPFMVGASMMTSGSASGKAFIATN